MYSEDLDFTCFSFEKKTAKVIRENWSSLSRNFASTNDYLLHPFPSENIIEGNPVEAPPANEILAATEMLQIAVPLREPTLSEMQSSETKTDPFSYEYSTTQNPFTRTSHKAFVDEDLSDSSILFSIIESEAVRSFEGFGLYRILDGGDAIYLGCGTAEVLWGTEFTLRDILCSWINPATTDSLFQCAIHLNEICLFNEEYEKVRKVEVHMAPQKHELLAYVMEGGVYREVLRMRTKYFKFDTKYVDALARMEDVEYNARNIHEEL
ncbi:hypothetical protein NPIL_12681 [Nephila pilipes]|uniref:Uncharacterized protein n=1 Tax=Nephila pilipes TaxID=299642 RepID=A0A8X6MS74_NEPPI|nr:hypothetical protein NPIL_35721 [Nephila pilipes]GFT14950.1 hypothetical protein NPIL_12681 [Nephila pilipes]